MYYYAVGNPILYLTGSFSGSIRKVEITQQKIKESFLSLKDIVIFSDLEHAKNYARSLQKNTRLQTIRDRNTIAPIIHLEIKNKPENYLERAIEIENPYKGRIETFVVQFSITTHNNIERLIKAEFTDPSIEAQDLEEKNKHKSCFLM